MTAEAAGAGGLGGGADVEQVAEHTRASTGCGGCRPDVAAILARLHAREVAPV